MSVDDPEDFGDVEEFGPDEVDDTVDAVAQAVERLQAIHDAPEDQRADALKALLDDRAALYGIHKKSIRAGEIENLMMKLPQRARGSVLRASRAVGKALDAHPAQRVGRDDETEGRRRARRAITRESADGKGFIPTTLETARIVLTLDPDWAGRIRANEMSGLTMFDKRPIRDDDVLQVASSMESAYGAEWPVEKVRNALRLVATQNSYHPVQDYLAGLPEWDGVRRNHRLLIDYFGADPSVGEGEGEDADHETIERRAALFGKYGRSLLIAMVARGIKPGTKVDNVLCLQGPQGWGKSSGYRALAGGAELFYDDKIPLDDPKRVGMLLRTPWLVEFAEFAALKRADVDTVKAFLTQTHNEFVPMHGRAALKEPRGCVFVASVNPAEFLLEAGRRWWVVPIRSRVKVADIERDRDQLFAEALVDYRAKVPWWLDGEEEELQAGDVRAFLAVAPTVDKITEWTGGVFCKNAFYTLDELWIEIMGAVADRDGRVRVPTMDEQRQFGLYLRDAGWTKKRNKRRHQGVRWYPPETSGVEP